MHNTIDKNLDAIDKNNTIDKNLDAVLAGPRVDLSCWKLTVNSAVQSTSFVRV